jgi:hypothetical protein
MAFRNIGDEVHAFGAVLLWLGFLVTVVGMVSSYFYDQTIGMIVNWVKTGSHEKPSELRPDYPSFRPTYSRLKTPNHPTSSILVGIGTIAVLVLQSWVTAFAGLISGAMFMEGGKSERLLWPAGVAAIMWVQSSLRSRETTEFKTLILWLGTKLLIAYIFFVAGLVFYSMNLIR